MRGLCALDPVSGGVVSVSGGEKKFRHYRDAVTNGICYLTEDRKRSGLFLGMSVRDNMISANMEAVSRGIWLDDKKAKELVTSYVDRLNIKIVAIEYLISSLSGGNQQKCLVGKWLSLEPKVIIMDEPTRGIDVGAKAEIHNLLRKLAESGVGVIIVSSELPEVMGVSDRIAVIHEGRMAGILSGDTATEENIMMLASGR
jgi:ribose transport system ATP-binding protein